MIVALALPSPPCARLEVGIQSAGSAGIVEAEVNRYRGVLDCGIAKVGVSVSSRGKPFVALTYLQWSRLR